MKKLLLLFLSMMLIFIVSGCNSENDSNNSKSEVKSIEVSSEKLEIIVGEELTIAADVSPSDANQDVNWSSSHPDIVSIDDSGKIKGLKPGTVTITAISKENSKIQDSITITVTQSNVVVPTGVVLNAITDTINKGSYVIFSANVLPAGALQEVVYTSSDDLIATVDNNGKVIALKDGVVTISVSVKGYPNLTDSADLNIIDPIASEVVITGENVLFEGRSIILVASVLPASVNQEVTWESLNEEYATVNNEGVVTGLKEGTAYIKATSVANPSIYNVITLTIELSIPPEPMPDLEGYEIKIMVPSHVLFEYNPFLDNYPYMDKEAKMSMWTEIEQQYNCDIQVVPYPESATWGEKRVNYVIDKASSNSAEADILLLSSGWVEQLALENAIVDTTSYYQKYGRNIDSKFLEATKYNGKIYGLPDINKFDSYTDPVNLEYGLIYNGHLIEELQLESPAKLFNEGRWTYTGFSNYVKDAYSKLSENQTVLSGKPSSYYSGMINSAGIRLENPYKTFNFQHRYSIEAINVLKDLYTNVGWGTNAWDGAATSFNMGNSIFTSGNYWFINTEGRYPRTLWDPAGNSKFGFVPYPYPDEVNKENVKALYLGGLFFMISKGINYPSDINSELIYRVFTDLSLRTRDDIYYNPEFDENIFLQSFIEEKIYDSESIKSIMFFDENKVLYDPFKIKNENQLSIEIDKVIFDGLDYTQVMSQYENTLKG